MSKFELISKKQYIKDFKTTEGYEDLLLPKRATRYSAGYDFFSTKEFFLEPKETIKIPTGVRVKLDKDKFLMVVPRSSIGFKCRMQLDNTVGIIDADYYESDNEGHIWIKITNDSNNCEILHVEKGAALAQGIILKYNLTEDDCTTRTRNGGLGSTDKKPNQLEGQMEIFKDLDVKEPITLSK
jgi:dUTP pyrophosphatase